MREIPILKDHPLDAGTVLILACEPSDAVAGCGGAIRRHVEEGHLVRVVVCAPARGLGDDASAAAFITECDTAANILANGKPDFWQWSADEVEYGERLITRILDLQSETDASLVYAPSPLEEHAGRWSLGLSAIEAARRATKSVKIAQYEVAVPLEPNVLLDITGQVEEKGAALACFTGLGGNEPHEAAIIALNRFRASGQGAAVRAAEAYRIITPEEIRADPPHYLRSQAGNVSGKSLVDANIPLVSVIIRSMDRPTLSEALDSIAAQTWPHIEIVVVNAKGSDHALLPDWWGRFPIKWVPSDTPLSRSRAANAGLVAASGEYLIFLDDDDLYLPGHVAGLVNELKSTAGARCIYSGIRVDMYDGNKEAPYHSINFNDGFTLPSLRGRNHIPIHAMLFEKSLVTEGCRFDESLDIYEDWDFWLQLSMRAEIIHHDAITAIYRNAGTAGLGLAPEHNFVLHNTGNLLQKWKTIWTGQQLAEIFLYWQGLSDTAKERWRRLEVELQSAQQGLVDGHVYVQGLTDQIAALEASERSLSSQAEAARQALDTLQKQMEALGQEREERVQNLQKQMEGLSHEREETEQYLRQQMEATALARDETLQHLQKQMDAMAVEKDKVVQTQQRQLVAITNERDEAAREVKENQTIMAGLRREMDSAVAEREDVMLQLRRQLSAYSERIQELESVCQRHEQTIESLTHWAQGLEHLSRQLEAFREEIFASTSWRITAPLRLVSRLGRGDFEGVKASVRSRLALGAKPIPEEQTEPEGVIVPVEEPRPANIPISAWSGDLIGIGAAPPMGDECPGRIGIHAHIYYGDLAGEIAGLLQNIPWPHDVYISASSAEVASHCRKLFSMNPRIVRLVVRVAPNRGRDIAPMLCSFGDDLQSYDFVAHVHTKKSLYNHGATDGWREYLMAHLLGSVDQVRRIFALLSSEQHVGLVYPQNFVRLPYMANTWLSNQGLGRELAHRFGIERVPAGYFSFPAGSMFWARMDALRPLFELGLTIEDFPEEAGQTDGTLAHCLERMLSLVVRNQGFRLAILCDEVHPSWTPWRLDHYLSMRREQFEDMILDPNIRLVVFDVFDTLLLRPLLNPESMKSLIARKLGAEESRLYLQFRARAEAEARQFAGRDVGLERIYQQFKRLSGLPDESADSIRRTEEALELAAVSRRPEAAAMLEFAVAHGKRVVLASDMYLSRNILESMLDRHGLRGWETLYLSSEIGVRKDSGALYRYLLEQEKLSPGEVLVIGDNEHSDFQIPCDMGIVCRHVLRPVELARALPRLGGLVDQVMQGGDIHAELSMGLIVRNNFHQVAFRNFDPGALTRPTPWSMGYSVLGPIVVSFVQWLHRRAAADGIQRLYFLAREGQFLKQAFDRWTRPAEAASQSRYLVVSRRTVTVASIRSIEDIYAIARIDYAPGQATDFLRERYGLTVTPREVKNFWSDDQIVEISNQDIDDLMPLLNGMQPRILARAKMEREALMAYLAGSGIMADETAAVVDIGYSATIQDHLMRLVDRKIHGYYLATSVKAGEVAARHGARAEGYIAHHQPFRPDSNPLFVHSFTLEKLLSSDDPQVVAYEKDGNGQPAPRFCTLSDEEKGTRNARSMIQRGAMAFMDDVLSIRGLLCEDFTVPAELASELYSIFIKQPSPLESDILRQLVLDDHYCGRGLVS